MKPTRKYLLWVLVMTILLLALTHFTGDAFSAMPLPLGPGVSFRYVQTFGETNVPYFADYNHLNYPAGIGLDSAGNLWVAEGGGSRAIKYTKDGAFLMSIGSAGISYLADETHFVRPSDAALDSSGNLWVVDRFSARVVKFDPTGAYLAQLGTSEAGNDNLRFDQPTGVAVDSSGNIYVSDYNNQRVQVFDSSGVYSATIGVTGAVGQDNAHFNGPAHIAVDDADFLYVADTNNHRVQIFNPSHQYIATLGVSGEPGNDQSHLNNPSGVAVDASTIYVADSDNHRVVAFLRSDYSYHAALGSYGSENSMFDTPNDVAVDAAGSLYVSDWGNFRVQKFNANLAYVRTFGTTGVPYLTDGYHYNNPYKVAVNGAGEIALIEDWGQGQRLIKLNANGVPQFIVGEAGVPGGDNEHFADPRGVAFDASGNIYVADCANHRIQKFSGAGAYLETLGSAGSGEKQFSCPTGVAFDASNNMYVSDATNQRIQIFNSSFGYLATIGVTGQPGGDKQHFRWPQDVEVDARGNIYVADLFNQRVQKFNKDRVWQMTLGVTLQCNDEFNYLCEPYDVAVDAAGNIYVATKFGPRVDVFDSGGVYRATIGGGDSGSRTGQLREPYGLDVDANGFVYIADTSNARIQKFAPGVKGWEPVNTNGFGERHSRGVTVLEMFGNQLYAGVSDWTHGGVIWRSPDGRSWMPVSQPGFGGGTENSGIVDMVVFNNQLYAGTGWSDGPAQLWSTADGTDWARVVIPNLGNQQVAPFAVFKGRLYAGGGVPENGLEIWRSPNGSTWEKVVSNGFGTNAHQLTALHEFNGLLYAATEINTNVPEPPGVAQVYRSPDGLNWEPVTTTGFGNPENYSSGGFATYQGYLYLGLRNDETGAQLWRSKNGKDWQKVIATGFGDANNVKIESLAVLRSDLIAVTYNAETGVEVWRSTDGLQWAQINPDGFGDSNNFATLWTNATAFFQDSLFIGTWNDAHGGELWMIERRMFLPVTAR